MKLLLTFIQEEIITTAYFKSIIYICGSQHLVDGDTQSSKNTQRIMAIHYNTVISHYYTGLQVQARRLKTECLRPKCG